MLTLCAQLKYKDHSYVLQKYMQVSRQTAKRIIYSISSGPFVWVVLLYAFALLGRLKLGHFPIPSVDDPKYIGLDPVYYVVMISLLAAQFGIVLWLFLLPLSIRHRLLNTWNVSLLLSGFSLMVVQIIYDPFALMAWLMD